MKRNNRLLLAGALLALVLVLRKFLLPCGVRPLPAMRSANIPGQKITFHDFPRPTHFEEHDPEEAARELATGPYRPIENKGALSQIKKLNP